MKKLLIISIVLSMSLYAAATGTGSYYVSTDKLNVRLDPSTTGKHTNSLSKGQKVEVLEVLNGWARISSYYSGKKEGVSHSVARWVSAKYLSSNKPKQATVNTNSPISRALVGTDDYARYKTTFIKVSEKLVKNGQCTIKDFTNMGGWIRSSTRGKYYTYCGGMSKSNRLYLNVNTGKVSKY